MQTWFTACVTVLPCLSLKLPGCLCIHEDLTVVLWIKVRCGIVAVMSFWYNPKGNAKFLPLYISEVTSGRCQGNRTLMLLEVSINITDYQSGSSNHPPCLYCELICKTVPILHCIFHLCMVVSLNELFVAE